MGRRSISSTKAGKFMNPTDQARKEARRKELKKNKKQRQQVREAVIKQRDPKSIINDLDALDKLEYDPNNPPPYSEKVIQEKRKKLKENLKKIFQYYQKEDQKLAFEIRNLEQDYEKRHQMLQSWYESIVQAQKVKLDDIPLPDLDSMPPPDLSAASSMMMPPLSEIPFPILSTLPPPPPPPAVISAGPKSILKSPQLTKTDASSTKTSSAETASVEPPGPPPGTPPSLSDFECDDDELETAPVKDDATIKTKKSIRFSGDNLMHKPNVDIPLPTMPMLPLPSMMPAPPMPPPPLNMGPYGAMPHKPLPQPTSLQAKNAMKIQEQANRVAQQMHQQSTSAAAAAASYAAAHGSSSAAAAGQSTIEAKPVLRNKISEVTKFVPTSLMVRRGPEPAASHKSSTPAHFSSHSSNHHNNDAYDFMLKSQSKSSYSSARSAATGSDQSKSTDSAYASFMKEIEELL